MKRYSFSTEAFNRGVKDILTLAPLREVKMKEYWDTSVAYVTKNWQPILIGLVIGIVFSWIL